MSRRLSHKITGLTANTQYYVRVAPKFSHFGETMYGWAQQSDLTRTASSSPPEGEDPDGVGTAALTGLSVAPVTGEPTQLAVSWDDGGGRGEVSRALEDRLRRLRRRGGGEREQPHRHRPVCGHELHRQRRRAGRGQSLTAEGVASGATAPRTGQAGREPEVPAAPGAPHFVIYHDPNAGPAAVRRYNQATALLTSTRTSFSAVAGDVHDEVDRLAGVTNSILPRFFLGDPTAPGWGPSQPKVNNGGLRWLRSVVKQPQASSAPAADVSVADARVREANGATLDFAVTLDRAPGRRVAVDYATADGTATAGADYTADERHADLQGGRNLEDNLGAGAGRRARRG